MNKIYEVVGVSRIQSAKFDGYCYACVGDPFFSSQNGQNVEKVFVDKDTVLNIGDMIKLIYVKGRAYYVGSCN